MLPYYAARFPTVEINYTFYRMPSEKLLAGWIKQVPQAFRFTLKAPRRITHDAKLVNCEDLTAQFCRVAGTLGDQLGALLFQLPPSLKKDLSAARRLSRHTSAQGACGVRVPASVVVRRRGVRASRDRGRALCVADSEKLETPLEVTADSAISVCATRGIRRTTSSEWAAKIGALRSRCRDIYVYFKHEEQGLGPAFARQLMKHLGLEAPD